MTTLYKFTEGDWTTRNKTLWGPNVTHTASGQGLICSAGYLHAYTDPLLAELFREIHVSFKKPILWVAEGTVVINDKGIKVGCSQLTTINTIDTPQISTEQRVRFAILCVKAIYKNKDWNDWADKWLAKTDRTYVRAADAAHAATYADAAYATYAYAAYAAADAARAATYADATYATYAYATYAAARAATYAAARATTLDFISLAKEAMKGD